MQKDMHYCCVKMLATKAGFSPEEAELIAYASQFTDDAVMHDGIKIYDLPKFAEPLVKGIKGVFEPICTAHKGLDLVNGFWPDTQEKVFIPFHYLPPYRYSSLLGGGYNFRVVSGSRFSIQLIEKAYETIRKAKNQQERRFGLIKLGIALHTYFDTWSHSDFSGLWSSEDNDLSNVVYRRRGNGKLIEYSDFGPDIGHFEIRNLADWPFAEWRAHRKNHEGAVIYHDNPKNFLWGSEQVFIFLSQINSTKNEFNSLRPKLKKLFVYSREKDEFERIKKWREVFPEIDFSYDEAEWEKTAIGKRLPYEQFESSQYPGIYRYEYQGDDRWLLFHLAAAEQRQFVLAGIKPLTRRFV